ncbi:hypothetical protein [Leifsonia sp. 21MFCrub1.1]|uniref:hypothetical protein n=1 Tax=Leifsonia sp. 21MFCrub1.1 TaxID=1798223 RepID=UPI0008929C82|nr:hypothetical protein [Leifsonia sp. 21MFCrub1.1]SEA53916.1 hypothetical protein SAMN04515680_0669 [Leifsonia sp. 21MFCrub1.1]
MSDQREHRNDDIHLPADASENERRQAGDRLRERIYVTFTALAILMAMNAHGEALDSPTVLWTLVISVVGVLLAGLVSDLVSHMIAHNTLPSIAEFRHMLAVSSRALGVLVVPLIAVGLAVFDVIEDRTGLTIAIVALIVSLAVITWIAVSRTGLSGWRQLAVLAAVVALGVLVVFLEALAH